LSNIQRSDDDFELFTPLFTLDTNVVMKNFLLSVIFLAAAAYIGYQLYNKADGLDWIKVGGLDDKQVYSYPAQLQIENKEGNQLSITLLGRSDRYIQFVRKSDGQSFVYPIDSLTQKSAEVVQKYPSEGIKNPENYLKNGSMELGDVYVEQLREEISKIDRKLASMERKLLLTPSETEQRTLQREYEALQKERAEFELEIAERE